MTYDYDVAVIGGGPGGYVAAIRCAQYGKKVALIEQKHVGGTCLNAGCIPTKVMIKSAELYEEMRGADEFGICVDHIKADFAKIANRRERIVSGLVRGVESLLRKNKITLIHETGELVDAHTIRTRRKTLTAQDVIIATGSKVALPPINGIDSDNVITSDDILKYTDYPDSMVIVGGGVIGVEFAFILSAYQKDVTIIEMMPTLLTGFDEEIIGAVTKMLKARGVKIETDAKVLKIENDGEVCVRYDLGDEEKTVQAKKCLIAAGRVPNTAQFKDFGLKMDRQNIVVDDYLRTNFDNIYAIGDATGKVQLAHVASAQGCVAAANINGKNEKMRYNIIPSCVYTMPECACVGMTQKQAEQAGYKIRVGKFPAMANGKSMIEGVNSGFIKIISEETTGEILGAHFFAARATDMIAEIAAVMRSEGTIEELQSTIHPHPTLSEMIMEAAEDVHSLSCHC